MPNVICLLLFCSRAKDGERHAIDEDNVDVYNAGAFDSGTGSAHCLRVIEAFTTFPADTAFMVRCLGFAAIWLAVRDKAQPMR